MARPVTIETPPELLHDLFVVQRMRIADIASMFGLSKATINNRLRAADIKLPTHPFFRELDSGELRRMYVDEGKSCKDLAERFGFSVRGMRKRLWKAGIVRERVPLEVRNRERRTLTADELQDLYINKRMTDSAIARECGVCNITVANWRRRYSIQRERPINFKELPVDELRRLYVDEKLTMEQIANHLNCNESSVRANIIRNGLGLDKAEVAQRRISANRNRYSYRQICGGYRMIKVPGHPFAKHEGYVAEHRYIAECAIGRYLNPDEQVHHINLIKLDNRIENLAVLTSKTQHALVHKYMERVAVYLCGLSDIKPEPLVFGEAIFWGGKYVDRIDLIGNEMLRFTSLETGATKSESAKPLVN